MQQPQSDIDQRRAAAVRAFWSDDPLNVAFRQRAGNTFSLRAFIAFVVEMPREQFDASTSQMWEGAQ
jgi:hypothetical protein